MDKKIIGYTTDTEGNVTGEILEGDRMLKGKSLSYLRSQESKVELSKDDTFIKIFKAALPQLSSCGLSVPESRIFFYLLENVRYGSNAAKEDNGTLITRETISFELSMPISNVHRATVKLCQRGLIAIAKIDIGKVFIVNPFVAMRGKSIDKTTYDLFKKTRWAKEWTTTRKKN